MRSVFRVPGEQPAQQQGCNDRGAQLRGDKARRMGRQNARKTVGEAARNGDCRIGKACRAGKPVGRCDVQRNQRWHRFGSPAYAAKDHCQQAEGGNELRASLGGPAAQVS